METNGLIRTGEKALAVLLTAAILTTGEGDAGGEGAPAGGEGGEGGDGGAPEGSGYAGNAGGEGGATPPDISTLFTPEEIKARQAAMVEYDEFTVPDGVSLDPEMIAAFKPLAKEFGLDQAGAQKLVDFAVQVQQRTMEGIFEMHEQRKAAWLKEAQADPAIGADVGLWDENIPGSAASSVALRAYNTIAQGHPEIRAFVDEFGIGNHPSFIKLFHQIGLQMREDTFELHFSGGDEKPRSVGRALWPNMN